MQGDVFEICKNRIRVNYEAAKMLTGEDGEIDFFQKAYYLGQEKAILSLASYIVNYENYLELEDYALGLRDELNLY